MYSTKYESIDQYNQSVDIEAFKELPKLTEEDKNAMENDITLAELSKSLNEFQNNKSPGCDGLTKEFYQCFWKELGPMLLETLNYCKQRKTHIHTI